MVLNFAECTRNRLKRRKNVGSLKLFPAKVPLEYVCIVILRALLRTARAFRYLLVIKDRFTKIVHTVTLCGVSSVGFANKFVND